MTTIFRTVSPVRSILKAVSVLESFTSGEPELSGADVARKVGVPITTARRILTTLTATGLLYRNAKTGKYTVGTKLYTLGSLYLSTTDIFVAAKPVVETLNDLTGETINVSILDNGNIIFIMKEESKYAFRLNTHIGSIIRAYGSAMGKALYSLDTIIKWR
jgi:DNA-binding IclR family transcriptional regulator